MAEFPTMWCSPGPTDESEIRERLITHNPDAQVPSWESIEQYDADFQSHQRECDLHARGFQNRALALVRSLSPSELRALSISPKHSHRRLLRAAVYAVSSRDDVDWDFHVITDTTSRRKLDELLAIWRSAKLYNWTADDAHQHIPPTESRGWNERNIVYSLGTQELLERVSQEFPPEQFRIAWLNMANAHHCCGTYNGAFGGSQEEEVATNCTAAATLGLFAERKTGFNNWVRKNVVLRADVIGYRDNFHIPPGGNYFMKTRFVTANPQVDCYMIATAFLDLRSYIPVFRPKSVKGQWSSRPDEELDTRLELDIRGTIYTAIQEKIDILVLGASGCGAFQHDPRREAHLWQRVLQKYGHLFKRVVFAVLPDSKHPNNFEVFSDVFGAAEH
eukprot:TRINITY_DN2748_c0_g1_i1.p1 TRINITY_DN2748_c0_g1~~TRINITY_DN2748_c0_g1_i1.p1  ORF type:complete len:398 (+),score=55.40 TRINITY_DN2748_c0_g1_i1:26-1195(+)